MGPTVALVALMFLVIAGVIFATLLVMRGWRSLLVMSAVYVAILLYVSLTPTLITGQMDRAVLGLAWLAVVSSILVRAAMLLRQRHRTSP